MQNSNNSYNFYIYSDGGSLIYKLSSENTLDPSLQGIFQALYFTASDLKSEIKFLSTEFGILSYKSFPNPQDTETIILLVLVLPNYFGDEELAELISDRVLDYLYHVLVIHIGLSDLYSIGSTSQIDVLKKLIETYEPSLKNILSNFRSLNFLLKSEKKFEMNKEVLYPIKHYLENFKSASKVDFVCLTINSSIVWASSDWLELDIIDRLLFLQISQIYCENDISEIPVYFSKTALENDLTGRISYKLFCVNLVSVNNVKLIILSDSSINIKTISECFNSKTFDEFFISRLINFENITQFGNMVDTTVKSLIVINNHLKTYKVMIDETCEDIFSKFIENAHFCSGLFNKNSNYAEFYVKDELYAFYYYKIAALTFLILYDKDTTFDDVNNVKITANTFKEKFDNKENYDETEAVEIQLSKNKSKTSK